MLFIDRIIGFFFKRFNCISKILKIRKHFDKLFTVDGMPISLALFRLQVYTRSLISVPSLNK